MWPTDSSTRSPTIWWIELTACSGFRRETRTATPSPVRTAPCGCRGRTPWPTSPGRYVGARISDDDPELLRFFSEHGIELDAELRVAAGPAYSDALSVAVGGGAALTLGRSAAAAVRVSARS